MRQFEEEAGSERGNVRERQTTTAEEEGGRHPPAPGDTERHTHTHLKREHMSSGGVVQYRAL